MSASSSSSRAAACLAAQGKQKRKKLRIKPGVGAGSRVVFDEDGTARDPLELLAARGPYECVLDPATFPFQSLQCSFESASAAYLQHGVKRISKLQVIIYRLTFLYLKWTTMRMPTGLADSP